MPMPNEIMPTRTGLDQAMLLVAAELPDDEEDGDVEGLVELPLPSDVEVLFTVPSGFS